MCTIAILCILHSVNSSKTQTTINVRLVRKSAAGKSELHFSWVLVLYTFYFFLEGYHQFISTKLCIPSLGFGFWHRFVGFALHRPRTEARDLFESQQKTEHLFCVFGACGIGIRNTHVWHIKVYLLKRMRDCVQRREIRNFRSKELVSKHKFLYLKYNFIFICSKTIVYRVLRA